MTKSPLARPASAGPGRAAGYVLLSGLAWGCAVTTFESLSQPPLELSLSEYFAFYSRILVHYGAAGVLLAWLTSLMSQFDRRFPALLAAVPAIVAAMAAALLIDRLSLWYVPYWRNDLMATMAARTSDLAAHMTWIFCVYGGLYVTAFFLLRKEALTRDRLREAELARIRSETQIDRALNEDMSPAVAPDLLLRALSELARRYDENDRGADLLLDKLVRLLRSVSGATSRARHRRGSDFAANLRLLVSEIEQPDNPAILHQQAPHQGGET